MSKQPIHPLQAMVNGMNEAWQQERSRTQMTLGGFIATLEALPRERIIVGVGAAFSYRGYYSDLAFEADGRTRTVGEVLSAARACMGQVFEGYKGGDFVMGARTPLWSVEHYSMTGPRIMGLNTEADPITLTLAPEDDDA